MSMAHLIVTDFGAIKSANIEIKKYNLVLSSDIHPAMYPTEDIFHYYFTDNLS